MRFNTLAEWLTWQETLHPRSIDLGLDRVRMVRARMGRPSHRPLTITVGGTNGKGSCVAMLDAILRAAGYRTGVYTSPHLVRYNERIVIDCQPVADEPLLAAFERVDTARRGATLSYFEFGTLAALDLFARAKLDVQILEVGLGGRLDAVNIVEPDAALIATIDLDHQEWLGHTRSAIGLEKAGIFRPARPAVLGDPQPPPEVLADAQRRGVPLTWAGHDFHWRPAGDGWCWWNHERHYPDLPTPNLPGRHQFDNAAAVVQTLDSLRAVLPLPLTAVHRGLRSVELAGRCQVVSGRVPMVLDVGHNPQAASRFAAHLAEQFGNPRVSLVFSIMRDKDVAGVVAALREQVDQWYLAPLLSPRAASVEQLREILRDAGIDAVSWGYESPADAAQVALCQAGRHDLVAAFGSFHLIGDILRGEVYSTANLKVAR